MTESAAISLTLVFMLPGLLFLLWAWEHKPWRPPFLLVELGADHFEQTRFTVEEVLAGFRAAASILSGVEDRAKRAAKRAAKRHDPVHLLREVLPILEHYHDNSARADLISRVSMAVDPDFHVGGMPPCEVVNVEAPFTTTLLPWITR